MYESVTLTLVFIDPNPYFYYFDRKSNQHDCSIHTIISYYRIFIFYVSLCILCIIKKNVQFLFCHSMLKFSLNFKKLVNFDIDKVWAIRIHCQNLGNFRQIRAILGDFCKKTKNRPHFFAKPA